jgi:hypothetical protein
MTAEFERRLLISVPLFRISPELLAALRSFQAGRGNDRVAEEHDAFMLDPGLGPATYLTSDGRILWDDDLWDVPGTRAEAVASIFAGIRKTGIAALREILPVRPSDATDCGNCEGTGRWDAHGRLKDVTGPSSSFICMECAGLGWKDPSVALTESVLDRVVPR